LQRDFRYLRDKHGEAGARDVFEKICTRLFQSKFENTYPVKVSRGDGGIDIFVGEFNKEIDVYQCKYFIEGIGDTQKQQIRESYKSVKEADKYKAKAWYLCLPCILTLEEHKWWSDWKARAYSLDAIPITLCDGSYLINELKRMSLYETTFDDDIRITMNEILEYLNFEKERIYNEIILSINDFTDKDYDDCIFVKKLESANITNTNCCKNEFFNAEIAKCAIESKGDLRDLKVYKQLKMKVHSIWDTQYRLYADENDGNKLLAQTYLRIEDNDTTALKSLDEVNLIAKKGLLHQLADECSIGWVIDYTKKLKEFLARPKEGGNS